MTKRSSKKDDYFQTLKLQNQSINSHSPIKTPIPRQTTCTHFRRQKPFIQLPRIFPIHQLLKHKRYRDNSTTQEETIFNLIGIRFHNNKSRQKPYGQQQSTTASEIRKEPAIQKKQTQKRIFLENLLFSNTINRIIFQKKQKLKVYIEEGNNSRLVNELMRRRVNIKMVSSKQDANIVWTQFCDWQQANKGSLFIQSFKTERQYSTLYTENVESRNFLLKGEEFDTRSQTTRFRDILIEKLYIHNHLKNHFQISDKKCLFKNIKKYCKNQKINQNYIIPITYHIENTLAGLPEDICSKTPTWIVKPGQDTNRGTGISVQVGRENIIKAVKELAEGGKSSLVQQYIDPLLYKSRKFDIRCYALVTSHCGNLKAYWYKQGYLRTCTKEFNYDPSNVYGHLTNDAIQKKHKDYGKYEQCNKLSYSDLQILLKSKELNFQATLQKMKQLAKISIKSAEEKLKGDKNIFAFEIFGYDFLIDSKGKVWLIQINTNPCLQFSGSLLSRVIWHMVQNSLAIAIDAFMLQLPQTYNSWRQKIDKIYQDNKFQCII